MALVLVHVQKIHAENLPTLIFQTLNVRTTHLVVLATHVTVKLINLVIVEDIVKKRSARALKMNVLIMGNVWITLDNSVAICVTVNQDLAD